MKEKGVCSLCGGEYEHFGNNPQPLGKYEERCCDRCNATLVIPARVREMQNWPVGMGPDGELNVKK